MIIADKSRPPTTIPGAQRQGLLLVQLLSGLLFLVFGRIDVEALFDQFIKPVAFAFAADDFVELFIPFDDELEGLFLVQGTERQNRTAVLPVVPEQFLPACHDCFA